METLGTSDVVTSCGLAVLLCTAMYTDFRYGKIYNWLTLPAMIVGTSLHAVFDGWQGLLQSLAGMMLIMLLFLLFAPKIGIGGGDTKLVMAVGAFVGLNTVVWVTLFSAIIGGVLAVFVLLKNRAVLNTTRNMVDNILLSVLAKSPVELSRGSQRIKFRYSPAVALGTVLTLLWKM